MTDTHDGLDKLTAETREVIPYDFGRLLNVKAIITIGGLFNTSITRTPTPGLQARFVGIALRPAELPTSGIRPPRLSMVALVRVRSGIFGNELLAFAQDVSPTVEIP